MTKVFVCAGTNLAENENINQQARLLGKILSQRDDITYVQGGSAEGLMGETLKEFVKYSNNVEFYIPDKYYAYDSPKLIKVVGEENYHAFKTNGEAGRLEVIKSCDEIIVLPGGTGTLEELLYCNETGRANEHNNRITVVNIDGYYDGLLKQISTNIEQGLTKNSAIKFEVIDNVNKLDFLNHDQLTM